MLLMLLRLLNMLRWQQQLAELAENALAGHGDDGVGLVDDVQRLVQHRVREVGQVVHNEHPFLPVHFLQWEKTYKNRIKL